LFPAEASTERKWKLPSQAASTSNNVAKRRIY
jgi:hypothetical protein